MIAVALHLRCTDARANWLRLRSSCAELDAGRIRGGRRARWSVGCVHSCGFYKHKAEDIVPGLPDAAGRIRRKRPAREQAFPQPAGAWAGRRRISAAGAIYGTPGSVVCDTHCIRICNLLGLASGKDPAKVEQQLRAIFAAGGILRFRATGSSLARPGRLRGKKARWHRPRCLAPYCKKLYGGMSTPVRFT